jgi:hypothetical protein
MARATRVMATTLKKGNGNSSKSNGNCDKEGKVGKSDGNGEEEGNDGSKSNGDDNVDGNKGVR